MITQPKLTCIVADNTNGICLEYEMSVSSTSPLYTEIPIWTVVPDMYIIFILTMIFILMIFGFKPDNRKTYNIED